MSDALMASVLKSLPKNASAGLKTFAQTFIRQTGPGDLIPFTATSLADLIESHHEFSEKRKPQKNFLSVSTPSPVPGGTATGTIIDIVTDDMAFLVDSVAAEINRRGYLIGCLLHPIIDKTSHIHIRLGSNLSPPAAEALCASLEEVLEDVRLANRDWPGMLTKLKEARTDLLSCAPRGVAREDIEEVGAFLDYMIDNNFTLLGSREYYFSEKAGEIHSVTLKDSGLGVLRDSRRPAYISGKDYSLPEHLTRLRRSQPPLSISKTNRRSTVHRAVPMDTVAIKTYSPDGSVKGERLFIGLFTSVTYSRSVVDIPWLRTKMEAVMKAAGVAPASHDWRALRHILEKYPRDELFQTDPADLKKIATGILTLQERQRIALYTRKDPFGRYVSCLVYVPRDRYETRLRRKIQAILEESLSGTTSNFYTTLDDSLFARVMFVISINQKSPPKFDTALIESRLQEAGRTWPERMEAALSSRKDREDRTLALYSRYREAFPSAYQEALSADEALQDIDLVEKTLKSGQVCLNLRFPGGLENAVSSFHLRLSSPEQPVALSDILPLLENAGLRIIAEIPYALTPVMDETTRKTVWLQDFHVTSSVPVTPSRIKTPFETILEKVWAGDIGNDTLNRLCLSADLAWRDIMILRAYVRYLRQTGYPFGSNYIRQALTDHPTIAAQLVTMFRSLFDPQNPSRSEATTTACIQTIDRSLEAVKSSDQDRILRSLRGLVQATLRTNFFQTDEAGQPKAYLSFKIDSRQVPELPDPRPLVEIFVWSVRMEGIHLRGDRIARGGIRWSDRPEDFRTEILGLMKAQTVKNAIIVPMGAKGGFVLKAPLGDPSPKALREEAIACYQTLVRGLLDLTDNRVGTRIVPPRDTVRRDSDDPYLVVAADKGTASFSDIANTLSKEYGFWLGDAFASGGSSGYDHKGMGITAKGAWESVKRHFRELNHDTQSAPFEVVGVGDMGGDVFGNAMILSDKIRLIGAFNHLHVFCDPDPDPAPSFQERKRLFEAVAGWDQYDPRILSKGGRIFARSEKLLTLTPEIRKRLDIDREKITPTDLVQALLRARTDLLWFGGIGTYVKSGRETHADVGDKSNDSLRVNATDLRTRVIGEGANLAMTQRGRIEFAEKGGRLNTDFIDNSGGVDCSDHEVNIKILLAGAMNGKTPKLTLPARDRLLESMTGEVAALVLRDNYQQTQALSLAESSAVETLRLQADFISDLEREQGLNRALEGLPDEEIVQIRLRQGKGLTRPELAILLAYAKILFTRDILASNIPDSPEMSDWVSGYFPTPLRKKYENEILSHRLKREIVATSLSNELTNRFGPTFVKSRMDKTGSDASSVARAYLLVRKALDLPGVWTRIEALDGKVPALLQTKALGEIVRLGRIVITWLLTHKPEILQPSKEREAFCNGLSQLQKDIPSILTEDLADAAVRRARAWQADGFPEDLARHLSLLPVLPPACDIVRIAVDQRRDLKFAGQIYFSLGSRFHFDWLRQQARFIHTEDRWKNEALEGVITELYASQAGLAARILHDSADLPKTKAVPARKIVDTWMSTHASLTAQIDPVLEDIRRAATLDLPMLVIAEQRLRNLYET